MKDNFLESDSLSNKRILIFGITRIQSQPTVRQIQEIDTAYGELRQYVDEVYCVSFDDFLLFDQLTPRFSKTIKFIQNGQLLPRVQELLNKRGHRDFLKQYWQFVCCINNGQVEFYQEHPFDKLDLDPDTVRKIYKQVSPAVALEKLKEIK
jgi:peroxiredoxin